MIVAEWSVDGLFSSHLHPARFIGGVRLQRRGSSVGPASAGP